MTDRATRAVKTAPKSKKLAKANFHLVFEDDGDSVVEVNCCLNCGFESHGLCSVHNVHVPNNGKCDEFD